MEDFRFEEKEFLSCCGSNKFAKEMASLSPFPTLDAAVQSAREIWFNKVNVNGWLEAFSAHPQIGKMPAPNHGDAKFAQWSKGEQSAAFATGTHSTFQEIADWNANYREKFGFVFLICASGRSSPEILAELKRRYSNRPIIEFENAAQEQMKITELRLAKLFSTKANPSVGVLQSATVIEKAGGAFRDASRGRSSGQSDDDVINTARRIYSETNKFQFKFDHAWRMLHNEPKWQSSPTSPSSQTGSSSKRSKVNEAVAYTTSGSNPGTPLSEGGTPDSSLVRPEGVKATKRGATRAASSNKEPSGQFIDDFLEIRKQELKMRAEDMEMRREALKLHAADIERKKVESERKAKAKEKKAEEKANEKERKYKLLENLMTRSGSLTPHEEFLKEQLMMELFTRV